MEIRIKLNPDNEKDKLIIEMLKGEYIKKGLKVAKKKLKKSLKVEWKWQKVPNSP